MCTILIQMQLPSSATSTKMNINPYAIPSIPKENRTITKEKILYNVCSYFGIDTDKIRSRDRHYSIVYIRHFIFLLIRENVPFLSLSEIGKFIGGRDHTTII